MLQDLLTKINGLKLPTESTLNDDFADIDFDVQVDHGESANSVSKISKGSKFSTTRDFNHFITSAGLVEVQLEGYSYTWAHPSASKMSKLDRFLVSDGFLSLFPHTSAVCLDRHLSDHRPILLREFNTDYGATPFRMCSIQEIITQVMDDGLAN
ncbi:RNA-directed DNA polymerase, eukaryota [Tanacetum coccineum]